MSRRLLTGLLALALCLIPSVALADPWASDRTDAEKWVSTNAEANLRAAPGATTQRVASVRGGTVLRELQLWNGWSFVEDPRTDTLAWVRSDLLKPTETPNEQIWLETPPLEEEMSTVGIATLDLPLYFYPSPHEGPAMSLKASSRESIVGRVTGDDGEPWYQTADGYYLQPHGLFLANDPSTYNGRWLSVSLSGRTNVVAYEEGAPVRSFPAIKGTAKFPTPVGAWSIVRRVANETMDSATIGIPRNSPGGYYLQRVLYTQYFRETGESLHYNYWSSAWGTAGSHGCLGLSLTESKWLWDWADIGTPVLINP